VSDSLTLTGAILAVSLIAVRIYVGKANLAKRAVLADSCASEFKSLNTRLFMLNNANAGLNEELTKIGNEVATILQRHIAEKSWPYNPIAPNIEPQVDRRTAEIVRRIVQGMSVSPKIVQQATNGTSGAGSEKK
jgi:hypothetical protein